MKVLAPVALLLAGSGFLFGEEIHWAFEALDRPAGKDVDFFVDSELKAKKLTLSPPAEPRRLLRRLYLDLIGLPPTPEESAAFDQNPSDGRYEAIVDDLLSRPQYGERWGRHWLDLARYADSNGLHQDSSRPHAWRYRDYVIDSFNVDKPYAQFVREQLAGDEIAPENPAAWIATGFCRNGPSNEQNVALNELETYRLDQLDDVLSTASRVFLAQNMACARCHDHKTEPFTQDDYYRLLAVFNTGIAAYVPLENNLPGKAVLVETKPRGKYKPPKKPNLRAFTDKGAKARVTHVLERGNHATPGEEVSPGVPAILNHFSADFEVRQQPNTTGRRTALANWISSRKNPLTWRVMANRVWQGHFGRGLVKTASDFGLVGDRPTHPELLDWLACELRDNGGKLKPLHKLIVLSKTYRQDSAHRKLPAATDPACDQLWRYLPHRLEAEVIRDAILAASGNLNLKRGGPGIKPQVPPEILEQSKRNAWPKVIKETPAHWRRSVYVYVKRQLPMPMLSLFDAPDASQSCGVRFRSTTPTQALTLLNDAFVNKQARYLALHTLRETNESSAAVQAMYQRILALPPTAAESAQAETFVAERLAARQGHKEAEKLALADLAVVLFNSSQFVYVD